MDVEFTAHNIRLDDGTCTRPEVGYAMESYAWFASARRVLDTPFPGDRSRLRLIDVGCLEGGFAVEFARKRWASWNNRRSFWIQREYLLQAIQDAGFDLVMEQYDSLGPNIADAMLQGYYKTENRGTFLGVKTPAAGPGASGGG